MLDAFAALLGPHTQIQGRFELMVGFSHFDFAEWAFVSHAFQGECHFFRVCGLGLLDGLEKHVRGVPMRCKNKVLVVFLFVGNMNFLKFRCVGIADPVPNHAHFVFTPRTQLCGCSRVVGVEREVVHIQAKVFGSFQQKREVTSPVEVMTVSAPVAAILAT